MLQKFCEKHNIFYGWVVVFGGILIMAVAYGIPCNCFSLYVKPVTEELGFTRQSFNVCVTIINLVYMLLSLFAGKIFKAVKVRALMKISCIVLPVSYFCYSLCTELWMFYAVALLVGMTSTLLTFLPFTLLIANWFDEKRGFAIGMTFMGSGVGGMLFNTLAGGWMETMGWQKASVLMALCIATVAIPVVFLVLKERPEDMGLVPLGAGGEKKAAAPVYGIDFRTALRMPGFWATTGFALFIGFAATTLSNTIVPHLSDVGFSARHASTIMSIYMGCLAVCKILLGTMYDKLGMKKATVIASLMVVVGLTGLLLGANGWAHVLVVAGAALGCAVGTVAYPNLTQAAFGTVAYAAIYGIVSAANSLSNSIAPLYYSAVYDITGSYNIALITGIVLVGVSLLLLLIIKPIKRPEA